MALPQEVQNYKRFASNLSLADDDLPVTATNRKLTDKYFLLGFLTCVLILLGFAVYTLQYSDINRLIVGYDKCGNVCGQKNVKYEEWSCTGQDMTDKPYHNNDECVAVEVDSIANFRSSRDKREYNGNNEDEIESSKLYEDETETIRDLSNYDHNHTNKNFILYLQMVGWKLAMACMISLVICQALVLAFRYATAVTVWTILILSWCLLLFLCIRLWTIVVTSKSESAAREVTPCIILTITLIVLLCIMVFMRHRVRLVILLIKESTKAVCDMPSLFSVPFLAVLGSLIIYCSWFVLSMYMLSSGKLTQVYNGKLDYVMDPEMIAALCINVVMAMWTIEFIYGIQYMTTSGAVAKWYYTRNKSCLSNPVQTSAYITWKFHLGTICLGSLLITLVAILKAILRSLTRNSKLKICIGCCMHYIEGYLRIITKNAYIMTALHGTTFIQSGKKVIQLIKLNICNIIVLNYVGDFVLVMANVFVIAISYLLAHYIFLRGEYEEYSMYATFLVVIITAVCSWSLLGPVQMAVDTMFVCFCEDCIINDGVTKPYFMTRALMEFVDNSKVLFADTIKKKGLPTI